MQTSIMLHVDKTDPAPACRMAGTEANLPVVELPRAYGEATISFANHEDPAGFCRAWAANLIALAETLEAANHE